MAPLRVLLRGILRCFGFPSWLLYGDLFVYYRCAERVLGFQVLDLLGLWVQRWSLLHTLNAKVNLHDHTPNWDMFMNRKIPARKRVSCGICAFLRSSIGKQVQREVCVYIYIYVSTYFYLDIYVLIFRLLDLYTYTIMHTYIYICIDTHTYNNSYVCTHSIRNRLTDMYIYVYIYNNNTINNNKYNRNINNSYSLICL